MRPKWTNYDAGSLIYFTVVHALCLLAPARCTWATLAVFGVTYFCTGCLGIALGYHRCLTHRSFKLPRWLEHSVAYLGVLASQSDPMDWVSQHRHHHLHSDKAADLHSPAHGLAWAHMGWLLDRTTVDKKMRAAKLVPDLVADPFYPWLERTYEFHVLGSVALLYLFGGVPWVVWGYGVRTVAVWHATFSVNSVAHAYGRVAHDTGDTSRNSHLVALVSFGEGFHNNHHRFPRSARHGLEWHQPDVTWGVIWGLQRAGLATMVRTVKK